MFLSQGNLNLMISCLKKFKFGRRCCSDLVRYSLEKRDGSNIMIYRAQL